MGKSQVLRLRYVLPIARRPFSRSHYSSVIVSVGSTTYLAFAMANRDGLNNNTDWQDVGRIWCRDSMTVALYYFSTRTMS